jgi:hypothetical protein
MLYSLAVNIFLLLSIAGVALYRMIDYYPEGNHVSYDIRWGYLFAFAGVVFAIIGICRRKKLFVPVMLIITSIALVALIFILDYFNILLEYEVWIHRGMPDSGAR